MTRLFEQAPAPTTDLSIIPSMLLAQEAGFDSGAALFDGTGNDLYAGWLPGRQDRLKRRLRVRNQTLMTAVRSRLPLDSRWNYFTRSALGTQLTLRLFRQEDLTRFYPDAVNVDDRFFELSDPEDDIFEWYSAVVTASTTRARTDSQGAPHRRGRRSHGEYAVPRRAGRRLLVQPAREPTASTAGRGARSCS